MPAARSCQHLAGWTKIAQRVLVSGSERGYNELLANHPLYVRRLNEWTAAAPPRTISTTGVPKPRASATAWAAAESHPRAILWARYCTWRGQHVIPQANEVVITWLFNARARSEYTARVRASSRRGRTGRPSSSTPRVIGAKGYDRTICGRIAADGKRVFRWLHGAAYLRAHARDKRVKHQADLDYNLNLPPASGSRSRWSRLGRGARWQAWQRTCNQRGVAFNPNVVWGLRWLSSATVSTPTPSARASGKHATRHGWRGRYINVPKRAKAATVMALIGMPTDAMFSWTPPVKTPRLPKVKESRTQRSTGVHLGWQDAAGRALLSALFGERTLAKMVLVELAGSDEISTGKRIASHLTVGLRERSSRKAAARVRVRWWPNRRVQSVEYEPFCRGATSVSTPLRNDWGCLRITLIYGASGLKMIRRQTPR